MKDELITFETAELAKEKGFDLDVFSVYNKEGILRALRFSEDFNSEGFDVSYISAPTQSLLQKWLREKHNIQILVIPFAKYSGSESSDTEYVYTVNYKQFYAFINKSECSKVYKLYEQALESGLQEALSTIKV